MSDLAGDSSLFGFDSDGWLERVRRNERDEPLGTLGSYELVAEAARGGQGVVYRARQAGTGRDIAVKRLLAGSFASPAALRRFEREVEAATALAHPGIVTVFGYEIVDGSPLLAMEWVDGLPLTRWAVGKERAEILAQFLLVCDAVQHAHQRGVLHRDLKPSNVLVDVEGRPRVLDFGLAKMAKDTSATITASGEFVGTPAYAAPEQWRGEELDARADVYSLGALLFEMLTRRRLVEGDALAAMAHALESGAPPRPSSLDPSLPRELDDIVLQAIASERAARYQSVDALAADLRRFERGEPVLAHPPGTAYLLRKLVARNRLATAFLVALLVSSVVYVVAAGRNARLLASERDRALEAGENERLAREAADAQRERAEEEQRRADALRADAEREKASAQAARDKAEALLGFLADDVIGSVDPVTLGKDPKLVDVLLSAAHKAKERFAKAPDAEAVMHLMLGQAFSILGKPEYAEQELRAGLAGRDLRTADLSSAHDECKLADALTDLGRFDEAEQVLHDLLARFETRTADELAAPGVKTQWGLCLNDLARVYMTRRQPAKALELLQRAHELTEDPLQAQRMVANSAMMMRELGRVDEAVELERPHLARMVELKGEDDWETAVARQNLGWSLVLQGNYAEAEELLRRALETQVQIFGRDHMVPAVTEMTLALALNDMKKDYGRAEELARHALAVADANTPDGELVGTAALGLAMVLEAQKKQVEALDLYRRAAHAWEILTGGNDDDWSLSAQGAVQCLIRLHRPDEAQPYIDRLEHCAAPPSAAWLLLMKAYVMEQRGDLDGAAMLLEDGLAALQRGGGAPPRAGTRRRSALPGKDPMILREAMTLFASVLRRLDLVEDAEAVEHRLAELGGH